MEDVVDIPAMPSQRVCPFDPPPEYQRLRLEQPVSQVRTPRGDVAWLVTRHEDIRAALVDRRLSSDPRSPGYPSYIPGEVPPPPGFFMQADAPDHTRLRRAVTQEFMASHVQSLQPRMQEIVDEVLDDMLHLPPPVDLVKVLAVPIASRVICELLGVPQADHKFIQTHTDIVLDRTCTAAETEAAAVALLGYFDSVITAKEQQPGDDLLGRLIREAKTEGQPSHEEMVGLAALVLLGAYDTMALVMALGVVVLLEHPEQLREFLGAPELGDKLVDELVRYFSINHAGLPRAALADMEIGGQRIQAGEGVLIMINSANRDASVFDAPDDFNIHRDNTHHVGFGHGIHKCLGTHFAKAELAIALGTLFRRVPTLQVAVPQDSLSYRHEMVLYGLKALPVTW
ncbi:cytochrome P450 [Endothiovibrio diazotrophicus]